MPRASELQTVATEDITVDNTSGGVRLTLSNILASPQPRACTIESQGAQLRWLKDSTAPTSTTGHLANVGTIITLENRNDMVNFRAIRTTSTNATIRVSYHR